MDRASNLVAIKAEETRLAIKAVSKKYGQKTNAAQRAERDAEIAGLKDKWWADIKHLMKRP